MLSNKKVQDEQTNTFFSNFLTFHELEQVVFTIQSVQTLLL